MFYYKCLSEDYLSTTPQYSWTTAKVGVKHQLINVCRNIIEKYTSDIEISALVSQLHGTTHPFEGMGVDCCSGGGTNQIQINTKNLQFEEQTLFMGDSIIWLVCHFLLNQRHIN